MHVITDEEPSLSPIQKLKQDPHIAIKTEVPGLVWRIQYADGYNPDKSEPSMIAGKALPRRRSGFMRLLKNLLP
ncbi:MAG: hypothetical protein M1500_01630 [Candidatus Marsarchaeota archaeon]|jgi:hypothetical protein|nr:hypothetical protein [Candidatus Marsarchaeota archaeon]MCL5112400.1 hypothetical protein [Candidatus Marsarchaeota archaeon]